MFITEDLSIPIINFIRFHFLIVNYKLFLNSASNMVTFSAIAIVTCYALTFVSLTDIALICESFNIDLSLESSHLGVIWFEPDIVYPMDACYVGPTNLVHIYNNSFNVWTEIAFG